MTDSPLVCQDCGFRADQGDFDWSGMDAVCPSCGSTDCEHPFVADPYWDCPDCGAEGARMHRPGSKDTCANCFYVVGGQYNDHVLRDFDMTVPQAQHLLHVFGYDWHGTPGDLGTRLRTLCNQEDIDRIALDGLLSHLRGTSGYGEADG